MGEVVKFGSVPRAGEHVPVVKPAFQISRGVQELGAVKVLQLVPQLVGPPEQRDVARVL